VTGWLLDTNILSELARPRPEPRVARFVATLPLALLYVSVVTFAEIRFGIEMAKSANRRTTLNDWLGQTLRPMFEHRVIPVTEDILLRWRILLEAGRKAGHTFSLPDLIIAAQALQHGLTVVSRDTREFSLAGASVLNPWRDALPSIRRD
jgi:hypothetical protein